MLFGSAFSSCRELVGLLPSFAASPPSSSMTKPGCHHLVWVVLLLCLWTEEGVDASHRVFRDLQSVQPSIVSQHYRTAYHFQPPKNWINDPNGPMLYNGIYHLFYQYNPKGAVWGNIVWAHAVSTDLVNWNIVTPAIYPTKPFDINGCWSGSTTTLPGNLPAILYTGIDKDNRQVQNIAFPKNLSDPYLREWYKPDYNPVIPPVDGINASAFRDPTTGWLGADGQWRVVVGSKLGLKGMAILYRSKDFVHWAKARSPLHSVATTGMWECPDFYPVSVKGRQGLDTSVNSGGVKHVMKVSLDLTRYEYYTLGKYKPEADRYVPDGSSNDDRTGLRYDYGNYYASKTFYDGDKKRRVLWGWANESDTAADDVAKGWAGIQSIPRSIWLDEKGRQLVQWPVEEIEALRRKKVRLQHIAMEKGRHVEVKGIYTSQADVEVDLKVTGLEKAEWLEPRWLVDPQKLCTQKGASVPGEVGPFGLLVLASGNLTEYTAVFFRVFKSPTKYFTLMCSDASRSSVRPEVYKPAFGGFVDVDIQKKGRISLRSLIDHSVVESFGAGGRTCITSRVYPSFLATNPHARLYAFNHGSQDVRISKLEAWEMSNAEIRQIES